MFQAPPLVSAILLSYDCAEYIAEALRSALAQDYQPMELIVSDDASSDETFSVLERELAGYEGPHRVELRRRTTTSGSKSAHMNDVLGSTSGEIILTFDGDDVYHPSRVRKIAAAFEADPTVRAVFSSYGLIDDKGARIGRGKVPHPGPGDDVATWFARVDAYASGTTLAVRREVIETFGPLDPDIHEDITLPFRASLLGGVTFLDEELVQARRHAASLTANIDQFDSVENYRARMRKGIEKARRHLDLRLADLKRAQELMPQRKDEFDRLREVARASMTDAEATSDLVSRSSWVRVRALLRLLVSGAYREDLTQNLCLTFAPGSYLRYKRNKLGRGRAAVRQGGA